MGPRSGLENETLNENTSGEQLNPRFNQERERQPGSVPGNDGENPQSFRIVAGERKFSVMMESLSGRCISFS